jgi:hypothetical protein
MAIIALVGGHIASLALLRNASPMPHPASGRTLPYPFSPDLSEGPLYITWLEGGILAACLGTALLCFVVWITLSVREWMGGEE